MKYTQQVKFFVLPYLLWSLIAISSLLFLRWILEYVLGAVLINQSIWDWWIPGIATHLIWFLVLRYRFKLLYNPNWKNNQETFIYMAIVAPLWLSITFTQFSLEYLVMKKEQVETTNQIDPKDWNTYYYMDSVSWDISNCHLHQTSAVTGRHSDRLNYYCYIAAPIDVSNSAYHKLWIGKMYRESMKNNLAKSIKTKRWYALQEESLADFKRMYQRFDTYLIPVQRSGNYNNYIRAIERNASNKYFKHRVFELSYEGIADKRSDIYKWAFGIPFIGIAICALFGNLQIHDKKGLQLYLEGQNTLTPDEHAIRNEIMLKGELPVTVVAIYIILIMYIIPAMVDGNIMHIDSITNFKFGAMQRSAVINGDIWRLFTAMFLHGGLMHLIGNLTALVFLGMSVEVHLERSKYIALIILGGLGASITSLNFLPMDTYAAGASGFLFALYGWALGAMLLYKRVKENAVVIRLLSIYMGINLLLGFIFPGVDNAAHLGGLCTGFVLAFIFTPKNA